MVAESSCDGLADFDRSGTRLQKHDLAMCMAISASDSQCDVGLEEERDAGHELAGPALRVSSTVIVAEAFAWPLGCDVKTSFGPWCFAETKPCWVLPDCTANHCSTTWGSSFHCW